MGTDLDNSSSSSSDWDENAERLRYQYGGVRYQFQGTAHWGPDEMVEQAPSNYAYPREEPPITKKQHNINEEEINRIKYGLYPMMPPI